MYNSRLQPALGRLAPPIKRLCATIKINIRISVSSHRKYSTRASPPTLCARSFHFALSALIIDGIHLHFLPLVSPASSSSFYFFHYISRIYPRASYRRGPSLSSLICHLITHQLIHYIHIYRI